MSKRSNKKRDPYIFRKENVRIPESWVVKKYNDITNMEYGENLPKKDRIEGEFPVYGSSGITGWHNDYHIEPPGIIVGRKGTLETHWSDEKFNVIDTAYYINEKCINHDSVDIRYLMYNLKTFEFQILESGSAVPSLSRDDFYNETVAIPPIDEQKKIISILEKIDNKIETNDRINDILEEMAQALFESWFIDFEPYNKFKKSELGQIPDEFEVTEVRDICSQIRNGGTPKRSNENYWGGKTPWIKTGELNGEVITDTEEKVTDLGIEESNCPIVDENTVLVALYGASVGNTGLTKIPATFNQACCSLQAKEKVGYGFVFQLLKHLKPRLKQLSRGSAQQNISQGIIKEQKLALPPEDDLRRFRELVHPMYVQMNSITVQTQKLSKLRDILLPKLMSGEIRVYDIELDELEVDSEV